MELFSLFVEKDRALWSYLVCLWRRTVLYEVSYFVEKNRALWS
jgi:hypothetical protein